MDKKTILRSFEISEKEGSKVLSMYSRKDGEFGTILCTCSAELNGEFLAARVADQAEPDGGYSFRTQEMLFFCTLILPLFNPLNSPEDGLSSFPQPLQSAPPQSE